MDRSTLLWYQRYFDFLSLLYQHGHLCIPLSPSSRKGKTEVWTKLEVLSLQRKGQSDLRIPKRQVLLAK
uniref:Uncharacterized protein n=1 Tax=Arundo donax TaxID=35708 RepID=A0A0A9HQS7_ARUDO